MRHAIREHAEGEGEFHKAEGVLAEGVQPRGEGEQGERADQHREIAGQEEAGDPAQEELEDHLLDHQLRQETAGEGFSDMSASIRP